METSPFKYGITVSGTSFTNREKETKHLKQNFLHGINTIIISPRRWGKSSLVEKVALEVCKRRKIKIVMLDMFTVDSEEAFMELFAREVIKASTSKWQEWVNVAKSAFKSIVPRLSFSIDPHNDFNLGFEWEVAKEHKDEILNIPEVIAKEKGFKFVICLDEFQRIADFNKYQDFEKLLRAVWQRQKNVSYCIYGSKRHMMTDIFHNSSKPFYRFGDVLMLDKISGENWVSFIIFGFSCLNKSIDKNMAGKIAEKMKNHPWYVQQLSQMVLHLTHKKAGEKEIEEGIQQIIQSNSPFYEREVEILSNTQVNLLKAILKGENKFTAKKVMDGYNLGSPNNVRKNKIILINADIVESNNGRYEFLDPVFSIWFSKKYFGK